MSDFQRRRDPKQGHNVPGAGIKQTLYKRLNELPDTKPRTDHYSTLAEQQRLTIEARMIARGRT